MSNTIKPQSNKNNFKNSSISSNLSVPFFSNSNNYYSYNTSNSYNKVDCEIMLISKREKKDIFGDVENIEEIGHIKEYLSLKENAEVALEEIDAEIEECEKNLRAYKSTDIHKITECQKQIRDLKQQRKVILNDIKLIDEVIVTEKYSYITTTDGYKTFTENYDPYNPKIKDYDDLAEKYYFYGETGLEMYNESMKNKDNDLILNEVDKRGERSLEIYEQVCNDLGYNLKSEDIDKFAVVDYLIKTRVKEGNETTEDVLLYFESVELINNDGRVLGTLSDYYSVMTEEERNLYHYIFAEYGESDANDYLESIQNSVNQRVGLLEATKFIAELDVNDKEQLEISLCNLFGVSKEGLGDGVANWFAGIDENSVNSPTLTPLDYKKMYVLDFLSKNGNGEILFNLGYDNVYQLSTSIGNIFGEMLEEALQVPIGNGLKTIVLNEEVDWSTITDEMLTSATYAAFTSLILGGPGNNEFNLDAINNKTKLDAAIITDGEITVTLGEVLEKAKI